jgi:gluconolactonase
VAKVLSIALGPSRTAKPRAMKVLSLLLSLPALVLAADRPIPPFEMSIEQVDPALEKLIAPGTKVEKLAEGFTWSEGPTWFQGGVTFSDVPENIAYRWKEGMTKAEVFLKPSGLSKPTEGFREQGSNGLATDRQGRLILCQHGDRRIARLEDGKFVPVADRFEGKRFNSPNDLALRKNGDIYFTDPPYGLDKGNDSPLKEIPFSGVYRLSGGKVDLLTKDLTFPNGIAFSPDEKFLYIAVSDPKAPRIVRYAIKEDGTLAAEQPFFDAKPLAGQGRKGSCDGMKIDKDGNVWATGPGGVLIISPEGKHLGTILTNQPTGNCCWGDDGSTLYITANMFLVRVKTQTKGAGW